VEINFYFTFCSAIKMECLNFANNKLKNIMTDLKIKNALITGWKRIGKAIAIALAKEGVNVILVSRTQSDLDEVATAVNNLGKIIDTYC
jgi:glutamyl-tRNA reductase